MFEDSMKEDAGREIAVFTEAIEVPFQDRAAFLEKECRGDENLRRKVEALLRAHDRIGDFLEEPRTGTSLE
jgi:eukaryotic-like serine/threonine-protein kinase